MIAFSKTPYEWKENLSIQEWDSLLSQFNGHPLQSRKWGESRKISCKINYHHWAVFKEGVPVFLVRFEERFFLNFLKIAWIPKGLDISKNNDNKLQKEFFQRLRKRGFFLCSYNPWVKVKCQEKDSLFFYTIWIDLTVGKEKLWMNLHKQCRNDIKRADKFGVIIEQTYSLDDLKSFYKICESISKRKGFELGNAAALMSCLFSNQNSQNFIRSHLFVARHEGRICAGAFLMTSGRSVHYLWGAVDREFASLCLGEALQWGIIEWAANNHYKKYDLEGISPQQDSGNDRFKKKFGGIVVAYPGVQTYFLGKYIKLTQFLMNMKLFKASKRFFLFYDA